LKRTAIACIVFLAAALVCAWLRHDLRTVRELLFTYFGLAALVLPRPYYRDSRVTIYHADCRDILPALRAQSVDMIWTDPPYGNKNQNGDLVDHMRQFYGLRSQPIANDGRKEMMRLVDLVLDEAARVLKRLSCCCVCCSGGGGPNGPLFAWLANRIDADGLKFFHSVIWDKKNGLGWRYRRRHEMVMVGHRDPGKISWADPDVAAFNVVACSPPHRRSHPNEKPEELVAHFIKLHTRPRDLVLDPFMGSGTSLVVAKKLKRRAIGIELEKKYCKIAALRLERST
jgi:site-specific DNA-methyltransferase (adenine-specific)